MPEADRSDPSDDPERVRTLILALKDDQVSVCWNAARALAKMGAVAKSALPVLSEALRSHDATTALWARFAIAKITGETAKHLPVFIKALGDRRVFPGMASFALSELGALAAPAVPGLIGQLSDPNPENRWSAAGALASIGRAAKDAVPALIQALRDSDEKVRWYCAWALSGIGPDARDAIPALIAALEDFDDDVRGYAARALGRIGPDAAAAAPILERLTDDENAAVRQEVAIALSLLGG